MFARTLTLFAIAACVSAVPRTSVTATNHLQSRLLNDILLNEPTGSDGQAFEISNDNGTTWQANIGGLRFPAQSIVGFREAGNEESAVILKNTIPAGSSSEVAVTVTEDGGDYGLEVGDTNTYIFTDYTKSPEQSITPGEWYPIRVSANLNEANGGGCKVPHLNATIFYRDGSAPLVVTAVVNERGHHAVDYTIDDLYKVQNITFSFGKKHRPVIVPAAQPPYLAQYTSADKAPLVTAFMYILGDFCDNAQG